MKTNKTIKIKVITKELKDVALRNSLRWLDIN